MPTRLCLEPRCPNPATGRGRCDVHRKGRERERSRVRREDAAARNRLYAGKRWAITRRHQLFETPLCELRHPGCLVLGSEVHHRVAMQDGGDPWSPDNLVSCCKPCHSHETVREQLERAAR